MVAVVRMCPVCEEEKAEISRKGFVTCRTCGITYTEFGEEKRSEGRFAFPLEGTLSGKGREFPVMVIVENTSLHGARIRFIDDFSALHNEEEMKDRLLFLEVSDPEKKLIAIRSFAKIVWMLPLSENERIAGLKFIGSVGSEGRKAEINA